MRFLGVLRHLWCRRIDLSVPLVYPLLAYLLVRMLLIAVARARGRSRAPAPAPESRSGPLGMAVIFLLGFRFGLNFDRLERDRRRLLGRDRCRSLRGRPTPSTAPFPLDNPRGDTYGPPSTWPTSRSSRCSPGAGRWDDLPAAHAAAIAFDLLIAAGLWLLGRRLRGRALGALLAYSWVAFPFTLLVSNSNANDGLVAAARPRRPARGRAAGRLRVAVPPRPR